MEKEKQDNTLLILALETLLEQVQDDIKSFSGRPQRTFIEEEKKIKKELLKIRNYEKIYKKV